MHQIHRSPIRATAIGLVALGLVLVGCGSDSDSTAPSGDGTTTTATKSTEVVVTGAWARKSPMKTTAGAAYLKLTSPVDDALVGVSVDASIAATAEIHETVASAEGDDGDMGGAMGGEGADPGAMTMRPVAQIALPASDEVSLEPGGYHVMLLDLAGPLEVGTTFDLTLSFEHAADQVVTVEVREG